MHTGRGGCWRVCGRWACRLADRFATVLCTTVLTNCVVPSSCRDSACPAPPACDELGTELKLPASCTSVVTSCGPRLGAAGPASSSPRGVKPVAPPFSVATSPDELLWEKKLVVLPGLPPASCAEAGATLPPPPSLVIVGSRFNGSDVKLSLELKRRKSVQL